MRVAALLVLCLLLASAGCASPAAKKTASVSSGPYVPSVSPPSSTPGTNETASSNQSSAGLGVLPLGFTATAQKATYPPTTYCKDGVRGYAMTPLGGDTASKEAKAYASASFPIIGCVTEFQFKAPVAMAFEGKTVADLSLGCDVPFLIVGDPGPPVAGDQVDPLQLLFIAKKTFYTVNIRGDPVPCVPGTPTKFHVDVDLPYVELAQGEVLILSLFTHSPSASPSTLPSLYYNTGGAAGSRLTMTSVGLDGSKDEGN